MRVRPLTFIATTSASGQDGPPVVQWLGADFPVTLDRDGSIAAARTKVPSLPVEPRLGILERNWGPIPQYALVVAPSINLGDMEQIAVSREPITMRIVIEPSAQPILDENPLLRQRLLSELESQNIAESCHIEATEQNGDEAIRVWCPETAAGVIAKVASLETPQAINQIIYGLRDTLR